jgi:two-component system, NtrC family, response regulator HydG
LKGECVLVTKAADAILIVDDNEDFCENMKDIVELEGHVVRTATSGGQAIKVVSEEGVKLVLMDVKMPVMDGVVTFEKMRELAPGVPVVMLTAYTVEDYVREALRQGAFGFLKKPPEFQQLFDVVQRALFQGTLVLTVGGETDLASLVDETLKMSEYRQIVAGNPAAAMERAIETRFDVVFFDTRAPWLRRPETYAEIRDIRPGLLAVKWGENGRGTPWVEGEEDSNLVVLHRPEDLRALLPVIERRTEQRLRGKLKDCR